MKHKVYIYKTIFKYQLPQFFRQVIIIKNESRTSTNKILLLLLLLYPLMLFSQKEYDWFLLKDKGVKYSYIVNEKEKTIAVFEKKGSFIVAFKVVTIKIKEYCLRHKKYRDFKWLIDNNMLYYKEGGSEIIEFNNFKNLIFALKTNNKSVFYKVENRIIEEN